MKRECYISSLITKEEEQKIRAYILKFMIEGTIMTKSDLIRKAVLKYIRNDKPDNKIEIKETIKETIKINDKIDKEVRDRWYYWWENNYR